MSDVDDRWLSVVETSRHFSVSGYIVYKWIPTDPLHPNNGRKEKVLIVWRNLTGGLEQDNLLLDEWFQKFNIFSRDFGYETISVNGSNNLPNLRSDEENWKVHLIEEEFHKRMWETGGTV